MKLAEIKEIVSQISYKPGWSINVGCEQPMPKGKPFIQISVDETSDTTLDPTRKSTERTPWKSGKRYLSYFMCRQEIVGVVMGLITDAEMHEVREWFRYKGASIFNPHLDPDALVEVARKASSFNVRENAMSMNEAPEESNP